MFEIHLGIPEMEELWNMLEKKHQSGSATKAEEKLRRQMGKAMALLSRNPTHPGLHSHEITSLTVRYPWRTGGSMTSLYWSAAMSFRQIFPCSG